MAITYKYVTAAGVDTKTGADWAHAMGSAEFLASIAADADDEWVYVVEAGTYTLGATCDCSARDGSQANSIYVIGVIAGTAALGAAQEPPTYARWGTQTGTDMPTIACGAYVLTFGDYWHIYNCKFTGTASGMVTFGTNCTVVNCIGNNTNGTARAAFTNGSYGNVINCAFTGESSYGISAGIGTVVFGCYFYSIGIGLNAAASPIYALFNVFDTCATAGFSVATRTNCVALNNTFNDCATAISITTGWVQTGMNNIVEGCTGHGVIATTAYNSGYWHKNHGNDTRNTDMWDGIDEAIVALMDNACSTGDPLFDAANFNNSLASGSPCLNNGFSPTLGT